MKINKILFSFLCCAVISSSLVGTTVSAATYGDLKNYNTDTSSGWTLKDNGAHRGVTSCKYKYGSDDIKKTYSTDMKGAISLWGSKISMSETTDSGYGLITTENNESSTAVATTSGRSFNSSTGHYNDAFTISINTAKYTGKTDSLKQKTLAHEIGHVYGLAHFSDESKIMNPTLKSTMSITSTDSAGMNTCTHSHTHTSTTKYTYEYNSTTQHKSRCSTCKAYLLEDHTFNTSNVCTLCKYSKPKTASVNNSEENNSEVENMLPTELDYENVLFDLAFSDITN